MKKAAVFFVFAMSAAALWAYPEPEAPATILDINTVRGEAAKPDKSIIDAGWLTTTSYFFNQLRVIPQTAVVPAFPATSAEAPAGKTLAEGRSTSFGFFHDLNYDGKLDEFLPLQLPPLLGVALNPDRADTGKIASRTFSLPLPSFGPPPNSPEYQLWLEGLSANQNIYFTDLAALARGRGGLTMAAQWRNGPSDLPEIAAQTERLARVPRLQTTWLAMLLGVGLILWTRRRAL
jgi:hypothetical protein